LVNPLVTARRSVLPPISSILSDSLFQWPIHIRSTLENLC
jgi:hypothetical protein